jgi:hypothetical protein
VRKGEEIVKDMGTELLPKERTYEPMDVPGVHNLAIFCRNNPFLMLIIR